MLTFATRAQIQTFAEALGYTNANSVDPATEAPYLAELVTQADLRANYYINLRFYQLFAPEYQADTIDGLPENVRDALQEATARAAIKELEQPNIFSVTVNPATDRQIRKAGSVEWFEAKHATTTTRVLETQTQDVNIHFLLDKFLLVPDNPANKNDTCKETSSGWTFGLMGGCG